MRILNTLLKYFLLFLINFLLHIHHNFKNIIILFLKKVKKLQFNGICCAVIKTFIFTYFFLFPYLCSYNNFSTPNFKVTRRVVYQLFTHRTHSALKGAKMTRGFGQRTFGGIRYDNHKGLCMLYGLSFSFIFTHFVPLICVYIDPSLLWLVIEQFIY